MGSEAANHLMDKGKTDKEESPKAPRLRPLDLIVTKKEQYMVEHALDKGRFSTVYKCKRLKNISLDDVAIKVQEELNTREVSILKRLGLGLGHHDRNIAHIHEDFIYKNHLCLATDLMPTDLWTIVHEISDGSICMGLTCLITKELLIALSWLKEKGVIHADLKMQNVLVDPSTLKWRVKLCDFGLSFLRDEAEQYTGHDLQPPAYRAPEIILGAPVTEAIDMWALGCLSASLFLGIDKYLFPSRYNFVQLRLMVDLLGKPPVKLLQEGKRTELFFTLKESTWFTQAQLKDSQHARDMVEHIKSKRSFQTLDQLSDPRYASDPQRVADPRYVTFLKGCLTMDPMKRLDPSEAMNMSFFRDRIVLE